MLGRLAIASTALIVLLAVPAAGQARRGRAEEPRGTPVVPGTKSRAVAVTTEVEIRIIRDYFAAQPSTPRSLPPGIARNLGRGKPLPPGIAKTRVPDGLLRQLPARDGARWVLAGDMVLLVDARDIIVDLVRVIL